MKKHASFAAQFQAYISGRFFFLVSKSLALMLLARCLGPADFGIYTLLVFAVTVVSSFGTFGMYQSVIYYFSNNIRTHELMGISLVQSFFVGTILSILTFGVFSHWNAMFGNLSMGAKLLTVGNVPFFILGNIFDGMLAGEQKFFLLTSRNSARWAANLALLSIFYFCHVLNLWAALAVNLFTNMMGVVIFLPYLLRRYPPNRPVTVDVLKECYSFSFQLYLSDLAFLLWLRIDYYFIRLFDTTSNLGIYALVSNINEIILQIPRALYSIIYPRVSSSESQSAALVAKLSRHIIFIMVCFSGLVYYFGPYAIRLIGGRSYSEASTVMLIQYPFIIFISIYMMLSGYCSGIKRIDVINKANAIGLLLLLFSICSLIPLFGIYGAAAARCINGLFLMFLIFYPLQKLNDWSWRDFFLPNVQDFSELRRRFFP